MAHQRARAGCGYWSGPAAADLSNLVPLLQQNGGSLTVTIAPSNQPGQKEMKRSWALQWEWLLYRLEERERIKALIADLCAQVREAKSERTKAESIRDQTLEQNDAIAMRMQFLIREYRKADLHQSRHENAHVELQYMERAKSVQDKASQARHDHAAGLHVATLGVEDPRTSPLGRALTDTLGISIVEHGDFPFIFLVYDTNAKTCSQRVIKIKLPEDCDPSEVEIEPASNWCKVTVPTDTASEQRFLTKEFALTKPSASFEFKEDELQHEGTVVTLVFDITLAGKRIVRLPKQGRDISLPQHVALSPASSCFDFFVVAEANSEGEASNPSKDTGGDPMSTGPTSKKSGRSHRKRSREKKWRASIPRTPSSAAAQS